MSATADAFMGIFGFKRVKTKRCKACKQQFAPSRPMQAVCSPLCAANLAAANRERMQRKETRERKEKLKTRRDWINEAQTAFNKFIRARDAGKPCICCGKAIPDAKAGGSGDAGHYRSVGSAPHLRFDERNCHLQDKQCNRWGAGRAVDYRIGLVSRIGLEAVEALESNNQPAKWSVDELKAIRDEYRAKLKELKANHD